MATRRALVAVLMTMASSLAACANRAGDCHDNGDCGGAHPAETTASSGGPGAGGSGGGGATSSSTGGASMCSGDPADANIDEACAVFVKAGASGGAGTRADPLGDLDKGIELAAPSGKRVYACGDFRGPITPTKAFDLWGGFACAGGGWTWSGVDRSKLTAPDDTVPLVADVSGTVSLHALAITAGQAAKLGGSSIAVVFGKQVDAAIDRATLTARGGAPGGTMAGNPMTGAPALPPIAGSGTCSGSTVATGAKLTCADGSVLQGGDGGDGGTASSPNGTPGTHGLLNGASVTSGGSGGKEGGALCNGGEPGVIGSNGLGGDGGLAKDTTVDIASKSNGFPTGVVTVVGGEGKTGGIGAPGTPGGGGGGAAHTPSCRGGIGGGGMTGGCGGGGGLPGFAGGSSIGVLTLSTRLVLTSVDIVVGAGAMGGSGGPGAAGGSGAISPAGATDGKSSGESMGCAGAGGGFGGQGGDGGGGRGGHAIDVVFVTTPTHASLGAMGAWTFGAPGPGGFTTGPNQAETGIHGACWNFEKNMACP